MKSNQCYQVLGSKVTRVTYVTFGIVLTGKVQVNGKLHFKCGRTRKRKEVLGQSGFAIGHTVSLITECSHSTLKHRTYRNTPIFHTD